MQSGGGSEVSKNWSITFNVFFKDNHPALKTQWRNLNIQPLLFSLSDFHNLFDLFDLDSNLRKFSENWRDLHLHMLYFFFTRFPKYVNDIK